MMGLAQLQHGLAQLYTNTELRDAFFADPRRVGSSWGLGPDEVEQLAQISAHDVRLFARSLHRKRLNAIAKLLPLTRRVLDRRFVEYFFQYADTYVPSGPKKHHQDALVFATFLMKKVKTENMSPCSRGWPDWITDLVRYETTLVYVSNPTCWGAVRWFRYSIRDLVQSATDRDNNDLPLPRPSLVVWLRIPCSGRLRHIVLSLPRLSWYGTG